MPSTLHNACRLVAASADVLVAPNSSAKLDTQVLSGERVELLDQEGGYTRIRTEIDQKIGWVAHARADFEPELGLSPITHLVAKPRACGFALPDCESPIRAVFPMNSRVSVGRQPHLVDGHEYLEVQCFKTGPVWVHADTLRPITENAPDFVAVAEEFLGMSYGWGYRGVSSLIDCSGIPHAVLVAYGWETCPRDSGDQAKVIGKELEVEQNFANLERGDFIFLPGHVAIMINSKDCLHANNIDPHHRVMVQPLREMIDERRSAGKKIEMMVRRLPMYRHEQLRLVTP